MWLGPPLDPRGRDQPCKGTQGEVSDLELAVELAVELAAHATAPGEGRQRQWLVHNIYTKLLIYTEQYLIYKTWCILLRGAEPTFHPPSSS
jgi:hypothetical protein